MSNGKVCVWGMGGNVGWLNFLLQEIAYLCHYNPAYQDFWWLKPIIVFSLAKTEQCLHNIYDNHGTHHQKKYWVGWIKNWNIFIFKTTSRYHVWIVWFDMVFIFMQMEKDMCVLCMKEISELCKSEITKAP